MCVFVTNPQKFKRGGIKSKAECFVVNLHFFN